MDNISPYEMLDMRKMMKLLGISSRTTMYKLIYEGSIPAPCRIGKTRLAWPAHVYIEWNQSIKPDYRYDKQGQGHLF